MNLAFLSDHSSRFDAADARDVASYVGECVGRHELRLDGKQGDAAATLAHRRFGDLELCRVSYGREAQVLTDGLVGVYHVQIVLRGHCHYVLDGVNDCLGAGQLLVINPGERIDIRYSGDCEKFILCVPAALFRDICQENHWQCPREGLLFKPSVCRVDDSGSLVALVSLLCEEAEDVRTTAQMRTLYSRLLAHKLLATLPHNVRLEPPSLTEVLFQRLDKFIEANLRRDICIDELAHEAHMSRRSLYLLFEKHAKTTPKNYVRKKRLEAIYSVLMNPASHVVNITSLALDYGFTHLGRFSEIYRGTFGILPSDSLRERHTRQTF